MLVNFLEFSVYTLCVADKLPMRMSAGQQCSRAWHGRAEQGRAGQPHSISIFHSIFIFPAQLKAKKTFQWLQPSYLTAGSGLCGAFCCHSCVCKCAWVCVQCVCVCFWWVCCQSTVFVCNFMPQLAEAAAGVATALPLFAFCSTVGNGNIFGARQQRSRSQGMEKGKGEECGMETKWQWSTKLAIHYLKTTKLAWNLPQQSLKTFYHAE